MSPTATQTATEAGPAAADALSPQVSRPHSLSAHPAARPADAYENGRLSFNSGRAVHREDKKQDAPRPVAAASTEHETGSGSVLRPEGGSPSPPAHAQSEVERWNMPRGNVPRLTFAFLSFFIAGMNDGAVGALIPSLEAYYELSYTVVSLIFLTPFAGYSLAAFTNARIHMALGQRGVAVMAPLCHIATYVALALHPPYPALVMLNMLSGFGNGLTDACFCAWVGAMDVANRIQGLMHSCYSVGALCAPLIATHMVVALGLPWFTYYYVMIGVSVLELVGLSICFWRRTGAAYRAEHAHDEAAAGSAGTREALKSKVTWLCSLYFFTYLGVEVGLGGWVTTFMLRVREASPYDAGVSSSGFWAGMAAGRATLGFVTERFGERLCLTIYLAICIGLELLFWLVPRFVVSAVAVAFLGFFLGPLFPGAVMMTAKLLPKRIHVSAIGFSMAMGGAGGTVFPFIIGAAAGARGVGVLQPIVLALIAVVAAVWLSFPRIKRKE